ncbi:MAG: hypothetical protein ACJAVI_001775 [Candidatus Azotimanducaceae bacterium]|jgi:hypothetical protein
MANRLAVHTGFGVVPESPFKAAFFYLPTDQVRQAKEWYQLIRKDVEWRRWGVDRNELTTLLNQSCTAGEFHDQLCNAYLNKQGYSGTGYIEHWPGNLSLTKQIRSHYPDALLLHVIRDPRAVTNSLLKVDWGPVDVLECTDYWLASIAVGIAAEKMCDVRRVYYENFVAEEKLLFVELVGIAVDQQPGQGLPPVTGEGQFHLLARSPTDASRIDAWQKELPTQSITLIEQRCSLVMEMLGYKLSVSDSISENAMSLRWLQLARPFKRIFNRIKNECRRRHGL